MFAITVALLFVIHGYCTMKAEANTGLVIEAGPQTTIEVIVEDSGEDLDNEIVESDSAEAAESVVRPVEGSGGPVAVRTDVDDVELGEFLYNVTAAYGVPYEMVTAIIIQESGWNANAMNGEHYGLMQINPRWHQWRMDEIAGPDGNWFDPYLNIEVGCHILRDMYATGLSEEWIVMAYNGGYMYAHKMIREGQLSGYAQSVLAKRDAILGSVG